MEPKPSRELRGSEINEFGQPVGMPVDWHQREPQRPVTLAGRWCRVEPLAAVHHDDLYGALMLESPPSIWTYLAPGPFPDRSELVDWLAAQESADDALPHAIRTAEGRAVGLASYLRLDEVNGSVEVGSIVFGSVLQRTAAATEAMYLMARHVFDDLGYRRYEWKCNSLNGPSRRAAARLGFTYEGTFRHAQVVKGRNRDTDWFSITDTEWPTIRDAFERWLDPANFDAGGNQLTPLRTRKQGGGAGSPEV